jgi:fructose-1,6-bisphosphatase/inositol monophosphatase family enzyme
VAAGFLLVEEAGGRVTRTDGSPLDTFAADCIASNGPLHPILSEHLGRGVPA